MICYLQGGTMLCCRFAQAKPPNPTPVSKLPPCPQNPPPSGTGQYQFISIGQAFFRERVLFVNQPITTSVSNELIAILLYLRNEDRNKPITLYCNIPGGERTPTMALFDTIEACKVRTASEGQAERA